LPPKEAQVPFRQIYTIGDKLVFVNDVDQEFFIYDPVSGNWTQRSSPHALATSAYALIGQQLIYPAFPRDGTVDVIDFSGSVLTHRSIQHTSVVPESSAVAAGNTVIFGAPNQFNLVLVDIEANTTSNVRLNYTWNAVAGEGDTAYFFHHEQTQVYSAHNGTWTVIPLNREIQDAIVQHAVLFNGSAILITNRNIVKLDILTGTWETLIRTTFPSVHNAILHDGTLFMIVGPNDQIANTILTHNLYTGRRFAWPYNRHNFRHSSLAAFGDKLYIVNWNTNYLLAFPIFVYDIKDTHYSLVSSPSGSGSYTENFYLYSASHGEYLVFTSFSLPTSQVFMYNLGDGSWRSWPWPNPRFGTEIVSSERYVAISGGFDFDLNLFTASVDIYDVETDTWSEATVPRGVSHHVILLDDTLFFFDNFRSEGMHYVEIYNISRSQWTSHELTDEHGMYTSIKSHNHLFFISKVASAIDVYDIINQRWKSVQLSQPRSYFELIEAGPYLYIVGGSFTASIEVFSLDTLEFTALLNLSEARMSIVAAYASPYVAFIGGIRSNAALSSTIDIYNTDNGHWSRVSLPQPELLGLEFGVLVIGQSIYLRSNSYLYILTPALGKVEQFLTPFLSGNNMISLDKHLIGYGVSDTVGVFYFRDTTTRSWWHMEIPDFRPSFRPIVWKNNVIIYANGLVFIELPVIVNTFEDKQLFMNQEISLEVDAVGHRLSYMWFRDLIEIEDETNSSLILHGDNSVSGSYLALVQDHCGRRTAQSTQVTLVGKPEFYMQLQDQMVLCSNSSLAFSAFPAPDPVTVEWTLDGNPLNSADQGDNENHRTVAINSLACDSTHRICAHAANPSGQTESCSEIHVVSIDSVFDGPYEIREAFVSEGSKVVLEVDILDSRCTSHTWFEDGTPRKNSSESESSLDVEVTDDIETNRYYVVATCVQGSTLRSNPIQIKLSALPLGGFIAVIIVSFTVVVGAIVGVVMFRLRLNKSRQQEIELTSLLNEAKQETMAQNGTQIIHTTTWEWSPDESFSFNSLEKLPLNIDTSNLGFNKKSDPVDINYWHQGTVVLSTKDKKRSISSFLQQSLIGGHHVEIYVPRSPKFEVKVDPTSFHISDDGSIVTLTVSVLLKMTTKAKIRLVIVLEKEKIYSSIDFTLVSKPSPWIDVDDIEMSNQILGQGGFGTVTRATYKGQDVAVKMLSNQFLVDYIKNEFEREVSVMKSLHHPNIIQFVGASNVAGKLALITEFAPHGSLASALENHFVSYNLKLVIFLEIARAIQFLHSNNIIHRDIKPLNVLVFSLEQKAVVHVKLTDFGTSKFVADAKMTMTMNTGTIKYMAPETLGKKPRFDTSADLFSFAVLMWEVITNQSAFNTPEFEWQYQIENFVTAGNRLALPNDLDNRLARLISDCWAQEPSERPPMATVIQQLSSLVYEQN
jgi:hypothetical protein